MPLATQVDWREPDCQQADSINLPLGERSIAASNLTCSIIRPASKPVSLISRHLLFLMRGKNRLIFTKEHSKTIKFLACLYTYEFFNQFLSSTLSLTLVCLSERLVVFYEFSTSRFILNFFNCVFLVWDLFINVT